MFGGIKDAISATVHLRFGAPIVLVVLTVVNLLTGQVWWPAERGAPMLIRAYTLSQPWQFWGTVSTQVGVALSVFGWYVLGEHDRFQRVALRVTLVGLGLVALGLLAAAVGFFV